MNRQKEFMFLLYCSSKIPFKLKKEILARYNGKTSEGTSFFEFKKYQTK